MICGSTLGGTAYVLTIRADISHRWTTYAPGDPLPPHALAVGQGLGGENMYVTRVQYSSGDRFFSYYLQDSPTAYAYIGTLVYYGDNTISGLEILELLP